MAVKEYSVTRLGAGADLVVWEGLANGDTGKSYLVPKHPERTIQFYGNFGGGTAKVQGSNDPRANPDHDDHDNAEWFDLDDLNGTAISDAAADGHGVGESPAYIRPTLDGGSGGSMTASLSARKN